MRYMSFALVLAAVGCGSADRADGANIIAVLPYSGAFASGKAEHHLNSITMALESLIEGGATEKMGVSYNVIPVNSGNGREFVQEAVEGIIAERADAGLRPILGIISSTGGAHEGSARAAIEAGIPHFEVSSGAHDEEFLYCSPFTDPATCTDYSEDQKKYMFSTRALCNPEAEVTADFIAEQFPDARVALFRGDKTHDRMHTNVIRARLQQNGFQGTVLESGDAANDQDFMLSYEDDSFEDEIAAVVAEHQPDVIFWHLRGDANNLQFVRDLARFDNGAGWQGDSLTCGMARNSRFIDNDENGGISNYLAGLNADGSARQGAFYFVMRSPLPSAALDAFRSDYTLKFGIEPDTFSPSAYDAGLLLGLGILTAGPDASTEAIRDAIIAQSREGQVFGYSSSRRELVEAATSGVDLDLEGVSGPLDWRESRIVAGSYYVERVVPVSGAFAYEELESPPRVTR